MAKYFPLLFFYTLRVSLSRKVIKIWGKISSLPILSENSHKLGEPCIKNPLRHINVGNMKT